MTDETYYKWLLPNRVTPIQKKTWPVRVKKWTAEESPVICQSGWHGVLRKDILKHLPQTDIAELWEVEVRGELVHGNDKFAAPQMRLIRKVATTDARMLRLFSCDAAQEVLWVFEKERPNDTRVRDCIEVARRYAMGEATEQERAAAGGAAGDAAWDAARDAARAARDAARDAAWAAAWAAAGDAAGDAAWDAARDAAWDAAGAAAWARFNDLLCERLGV